MDAEAPTLEVRLSGTGGQGLILGGRMLAEACMLNGRFVAQSQSYEPTSRGGVSRSDLVISSGEPEYPLVTSLDALVIMDQSAWKISGALVSGKCVVLADAELVPEPPPGAIVVPLTAEARRLRNVRVANVVSLGALVFRTGICPFDVLETAVERLTPTKFRKLNLDALRAGAALVAEG